MKYYIKEVEITINNIILIVNSYYASFTESFEEKETMINGIKFKYKICENESTDMLFYNDNDDIPIKLFENNEYQFKFNTSMDTLDINLDKAIFSKIHVINNKFTCTYSSNNYVGILNLEHFNIIYSVIEVESRKINYKNDFSLLVEILSEEIIDLISQDTSFHQSFISKSDDINTYEKNLYSCFSYIKAFLAFDKMPLYLSYLINRPYKTTINIRSEQNIWEVDDLEIDELMNAYSDKSNLLHVNKEYLGLSIDIVPLSIMNNDYTDTVDNFENRFIHHTLELIYHYLLNIKKDSLSKKFLWEIEQSKLIVSQYLDLHFFRSLSKIKCFSLNSKVLQRKYPYNKFLKFYFSLDMSSKIGIDLFDDKVCMGQKNVPTMYEYFCFIKFTKEFDKVYNRESLVDNNIVNYQEKSCNFKLKSGIESCIEYKIKNNIFLKLFYNKTYTPSNFIVAGRSYSNSLTPDISIELFSKDKLIGIIHFDAKYKLNNKNSFKAEDIDKMHTYRDAIMGTLASYILYPGNDEKIFIKEEKDLKNESILPAVGACPLSINGKNNEVEYIFSIIEKFVELADDYEHGVFTSSAVSYNGIERIIGIKKKNEI